MNITRTIQITSTHATLSEAVEASGMDLSYNPQSAAQSIRDTERGRDGWKSGKAYVTPEGVFYVYHCDINILHKFEPFHSMITSDPFKVVEITSGAIYITDTKFSRTQRPAIRKAGLTVTIL